MSKLSQQGQNPTHSRERHDLVLVNGKSPSPPRRTNFSSPVFLIVFKKHSQHRTQPHRVALGQKIL